MCYSGLGHTLVSRILIPNKILTILQSYNTKENISTIHLDITKKTEYVRYVQRFNESGAKKIKPQSHLN